MLVIAKYFKKSEKSVLSFSLHKFHNKDTFNKLIKMIEKIEKKEKKFNLSIDKRNTDKNILWLNVYDGFNKFELNEGRHYQLKLSCHSVPASEYVNIRINDVEPYEVVDDECIFHEYNL